MDASSTPPAPLTIAQFQALIRERYLATDRARGAAATWLWLCEEFGELAHAVAKAQKGERDDANLREEFADVIAWLTTIANVLDVDLERALREKYLRSGGPKGTK
ncbi:MAG: nucleotide pyrophosphohydrolase [Phycisphaerae bacterium]|nr:nucleotide pyrophosphohydrolase [Phycisphaerae bacterium]